ncbi:ATP-dependent zinc metalloprotease FtsH [Balneolales bacterium ANBcel1]|nr:ATP-dependent zinc metalloprotease FtsH [Balneolales bacterium ANBcel1]
MSKEQKKNEYSGKRAANKPSQQVPGPSRIMVFYFLIAAILGVWILYSYYGGQFSPDQINYSTFRNQLKLENVSEVTIQGDRVEGRLRDAVIRTTADGDTISYTEFVTHIPSFGDDRLMDLLEESNVEVTTIPERDNTWLYFVFMTLPFLLILIIAITWYRRMNSQGQGMFSIGKSQAKLHKPGDGKRTTFDDVAGGDEAKRELQEIVSYLKDPSKFEKLGVKVPKGVLLYGAPGTGKTLMARAVAGEAGVPFYSITGSDFMEMLVGVGAKRVREMFKNAKEAAPAIIFIDELDSIGRRRGAGLGGGHDEREQTLNQLLSEMDGFEANESVIVMAATNRPDILDKALLRPGRFNRRVEVGLPSQEDRVKILEIHARNKPLADDVDFENVSRGTPGFTGADLENLLNEAAMMTAREDRDKISQRDIDLARDKILMGLERKGVVLDEEERRMLAYHEAGHAIVAAVLDNTDPVHKVTIIPRGQAMGVTQQLPERDQYLYRKEHLLDRLAVIMGGRAAERMIFNTATSGAENDLKQVTKLARKMVLDWGMSDMFRYTALGGQREEVFLGEQMGTQREYSDETAREADKAVNAILEEAYNRAEEVLKKHKKAFDGLAELLLEKEEVMGNEILKLVGKKPRTPKKTTVAGSIGGQNGSNNRKKNDEAAKTSETTSSDASKKSTPDSSGDDVSENLTDGTSGNNRKGTAAENKSGHSTDKKDESDTGNARSGKDTTPDDADKS